MLGQLETTLKRACCEAAIQIVTCVSSGFISRYHEQIRFLRKGELPASEACHSDRDRIGMLAGSHDIVQRPVVRGRHTRCGVE